jgi:hypothetical protein
MIKRIGIFMLGAGLLVGGVIGFASVTASASTTTSTTSPIIGGNDGHVDGTATITNDPAAGTVTITLTPSAGLTFTGGFVCIADNNPANTGTTYFTYNTGFTARVNPGGDTNGCVTGTYFVLQQFTNGGPWVVTVPASFFTDGMYLQIHVNVSNGDTGFPCAVLGGSFYGNCKDPGTSTEVPAGTIGGLGVAALAGGSLVFMQRRRFRGLRTRKSTAA